MQRHTTISYKLLPFKWAYGFIALVLLIAFAGRVSVICINGGTGLNKAQQTLTENNEEQNDKQGESKFDEKQFAEFISPGFIQIPGSLINTHIADHPAYLPAYINVPLITVITPPPDKLFV